MEKKKLNLIKYRGFYSLNNPELGVTPHFFDELRYRINNMLCTHVVITGEAGLGKSYMAMALARILEGKKKATGEDRFTVNQVVFKHGEYMELLIKPNFRQGKCIVFDEPGYALGKRDWFKELQKVLVHTLESQRFLVHPLLMPIISMALLDKTIRNYLIQYQIHMVARGHGLVYEIQPSKNTDKVYHHFKCHLYIRMLDREKCSKSTCLDCDRLGDNENPKSDDCQLFRAQYERKKKTVQYDRYEQAKVEASQKESLEMTDKQLESMIIDHVSQLLNVKGKLDVAKLRLYLREEYGIHVSIWKGYNIKSMIEAAHPKEFEE